MTSAETEISADGKVTSQRYIIDFLALFWVFFGYFEMILAHLMLQCYMHYISAILNGPFPSK